MKCISSAWYVPRSFAILCVGKVITRVGELEVLRMATRTATRTLRDRLVTFRGPVAILCLGEVIVGVGELGILGIT